MYMLVKEILLICYYPLKDIVIKTFSEKPTPVVFMYDPKQKHIIHVVRYHIKQHCIINFVWLTLHCNRYVYVIA